MVKILLRVFSNGINRFLKVERASKMKAMLIVFFVMTELVTEDQSVY